MTIIKFLNKLHINTYTIILIFLAFLAGLFKEIIIISIIIIIHEFGHFYALNKYSWNVKRIDIFPFGGITKTDDKIDKPLKEELIISIMGPLFQEILFIIILIFYKYNIMDTYFYKLFKDYNITMLFFNLMPIIPLDGSKILNILLNKIFNFRISYILNIIISIIFLIVFAIIFKSDSSYYLIIVFLIYQILYSYKNRYIVYNRFILEKRLKKSNYIKYKKVNNVKKMYRNKRNLIKKDGSYITEYKYINKK
ncbi:MAG: hypothetical protein IJ105_04600 [Bacilli bacterium]|nr:hypothetical protein [Bacilli bacterium]